MEQELPNFNFASIGLLSTPFREKFGVPRQSLMLSEARGLLKLKPDPKYAQAFRHLEQFSHIWLVFVFHQSLNRAWHLLIDTPRLEATEKIGVFATRSPHRPNCIGISAVKLERIDLEAKGGVELHLSGLDLLDGTPVLDIKPYLPYADCITEANSGWIQSRIRRYPVIFSDAAKFFIAQHLPQDQPLLEQMLSFDPRPVAQQRAVPIGEESSEGVPFAFRFLDYDVRWEIRNSSVYVTELLAHHETSQKA